MNYPESPESTSSFSSSPTEEDDDDTAQNESSAQPQPQQQQQQQLQQKGWPSGSIAPFSFTTGPLTQQPPAHTAFPHHDLTTVAPVLVPVPAAAAAARREKGDLGEEKGRMMQQANSLTSPKKQPQPQQQQQQVPAVDVINRETETTPEILRLRRLLAMSYQHTLRLLKFKEGVQHTRGERRGDDDLSVSGDCAICAARAKLVQVAEQGSRATAVSLTAEEDNAEVEKGERKRTMEDHHALATVPLEVHNAVLDVLNETKAELSSLEQRAQVAEQIAEELRKQYFDAQKRPPQFLPDTTTAAQENGKAIASEDRGAATTSHLLVQKEICEEAKAWCNQALEAERRLRDVRSVQDFNEVENRLKCAQEDLSASKKAFHALEEKYYAVCKDAQQYLFEKSVLSEQLEATALRLGEKYKNRDVHPLLLEDLKAFGEFQLPSNTAIQEEQQSTDVEASTPMGHHQRLGATSEAVVSVNNFRFSSIPELLKKNQELVKQLWQECQKSSSKKAAVGAMFEGTTEIPEGKGGRRSSDGLDSTGEPMLHSPRYSLSTTVRQTTFSLLGTAGTAMGENGTPLSIARGSGGAQQQLHRTSQKRGREQEQSHFTGIGEESGVRFSSAASAVAALGQRVDHPTPQQRMLSSLDEEERLQFTQRLRRSTSVGGAIGGGELRTLKTFQDASVMTDNIDTLALMFASPTSSSSVSQQQQQRPAESTGVTSSPQDSVIAPCSLEDLEQSSTMMRQVLLATIEALSTSSGFRQLATQEKDILGSTLYCQMKAARAALDTCVRQHLSISQNMVSLRKAEERSDAFARENAQLRMEHTACNTVREEVKNLSAYLETTMQVEQRLQQAVPRQKCDELVMQLSRFSSLLNSVSLGEQSIKSVLEQQQQQHPVERRSTNGGSMEIFSSPLDRGGGAQEEKEEREGGTTGAALTGALREVQSELASTQSALSDEKKKVLELLERMWVAEATAEEKTEEYNKLKEHVEADLVPKETYDAVVTETQELRTHLQQQRLSVEQARKETEWVRQKHSELLSSLNEKLAVFEEQRNREEAKATDCLRQLEDSKRENSKLTMKNIDLQRDLGLSKEAVEAAGRTEKQHLDQIRALQDQVEDVKGLFLQEKCALDIFQNLFPDDKAVQISVGRIRILTERMHHSAGRIADLETQVLQLENALGEAEAARMKETQNNARLSATLMNLRSTNSVEMGTIREKLFEKEAELETLRTALRNVQKEVESAKEREQKQQQMIEVLSSDPISLNVRRFGLTATKNVQAQLEELNTRFVSVQKDLKGSQEEAESLKRNISELKEKLVNAEAQHNAQSQQLAISQQSLASTENRLAQALQKIQELEKERDELKVDLQHRGKTITEFTEREEKNIAKIEQLQQALAATESQLKEVHQSLDHTTSEWKEVTAKHAELSTSHRSLQGEMSTVKQQNESLLDDNMALTENVKELQQNIKELQQQAKAHHYHSGRAGAAAGGGVGARGASATARRPTQTIASSLKKK